jgi:PKD repeat protein
MIQLNFKPAVQRLVFGIVLHFITVMSATAQCNFNFTPGNPCPGDVVTFTVTNPQMNTTYTWDLDGDGANDDGTGSSVTFTYPFSTSVANYVVKLYSNGTVCGNAQTVLVKEAPNPSIGVSTNQSLIGNIISACGAAQNDTLGIYNTSNPAGVISTYVFSWGDGSMNQTFTNSNFNLNTPVYHVYNGLGYKTITLTATHNNGCVTIRTYQYFNGSNPSVGLTIQGGTVGLCAPSTLTFPLSNYQSNPPGTTYTFLKNDEVIGQYNQSNVPANFVYTFNESSCGETTPTGQPNAFAITVIAANPCDSSFATVQPIRLSSKPIPDFLISYPPNNCPGEEFAFMNTSTNIHELISGQCKDTLSAEWVISPGVINVDYQITSGSMLNSNKIKVKFITPGTYSITMKIKPTPVCGPAVITKTITILEPPTAQAVATFSNPNGCAPLTVDFDNQSTGYQVNYTWSVIPATGWAFGGGSTANSFEPSIIFSTPGTYIVTLKAKNVCAEDVWMKTIVVKGKPLITLPDLGPFCQTATLNFTTLNTQIGANLGTISGYSWDFPGGTPSSSTSAYPTGIQYSVTSATMFNYTVTVTNECGATTATKQFEIQVPPTLTMPPDLTVCSNGTTKQLSASPAGGTWSGSGVTPSGLFDPSMAGGPGVKILTYKYGSGVCLAQGTINVTVVAPPTVNAGADLQACVNETNLALGGSPGGGVWTSSGSGVVVGTTFNPALSGVGIYTLTYVVTNQDGCVSSDVRVVTVKALPVINVSNVTYCNALGTVTLPIATPAGGTWSGPGISGNQFNPTVAGGVGTYTGTYTYMDLVTQCTNSAMITITVISPTTIDAGPDTALCQNITSFDLSAGVTPIGGTWTTTGIGVSGNIFNASIAGPGVHTITYTFGSGSCLVKDTRVITVNLLPSVNAGLDQKTCIDNTAIVLSATPVGGTWTSSGSGVITGTTFNPSASGIGAFTLTYAVTDANSCSNSDALIITVNPLPSINVSDTLYCNIPGFVQLPAANPSGGIWSGTGVSGNQFNPATAGGIGSYTASYTYVDPGTMCTNLETINIEVINPALVSAGIDTALCINAPDFDLNTGVTPIGGTWTSTGNGLSGSIFNPAIAGAGTYTLTYSVGAGNCLVKDTRIIKVNPLPVVVAGVDQNVCINEIALVLAGTPTGGNWSSTNGGVVNTGVFNPALSGAGSFTLTYSLTDANMCANSDALNITVNPLPIIHVGDTIYCNTPGLVALPFANPGGGTWSGLGIVGNQFNPITAGGIGTYQAIYTYTYATTQCKNADTIKIEVINPALVSAGIDTAFCINAPDFDLNTGVSPIGGTWTSTGNGVSGSIFKPSTAGAGTYTLTYSVGAGNCLVTDMRVIKVNPLPIVAAGTDQKACINETILNLMGVPTGGTWSSDNGGIVAAGIFNPLLSGTGIFNVKYLFTDLNGCTAQDEAAITVNPLPVIAVGDTVYCNTPGLVALPVSSPTGGVWTGTGISGSDFDPVGAGGVGIYKAIYKYTNSATLCSNQDTVQIEVINPQLVNAGADTAFCESVTIFDLSSGGTLPVTGGVWTSASNGLLGTQFNPNTAGPGLHTLTYSVGTGNCLVSDMRIIEVWGLPVVSAGTDLSACVSDSSIELTPSPFGGTWVASPTAVLSGNTFKVNASGTGNYSLSYSFTDGNGCMNNDVSNLVVHGLPILTAHDTTFCNTPGLVTLPVSTPAGGNWSGIGISGLDFDPVSAGGVGVYPATYSYTDQNACKNEVTVKITVIDPPVVNAGLDDTLCISNGILSLSGYLPTVGGFWSGQGIANTQIASFDPVLAGGGVHFITYTFGTGNCLVRDSAKFWVIDVPIEAGPDRTACLDDTPILLSGFNPIGGVWAGPGIINSAGVFSSTVATVGTAMLHYRYTDPVLACVFTDSLQITVHPMPESDFAQPSENCINQSITFDNLSQSTYSVHWSFGDGTNSMLAEPEHTYADTGTYIITLITQNQFGCQDSVKKSIFVTEPPFAYFTTTPDSGCAVLQVAFLNNSYGYQTTYNWNFGNGQTSSLYDPGTISFQQGTKDTVYTIHISAHNLCATREWTDSVKVFPWPLANFGTTLDTICTGEKIGFNNITLGNPDTFNWDFGNGMSSTDSLPDDIQYFTDSLYKTYTVRLIATNFCGSDTTEYPVVVKPIDVRAFFNIPNKTGCEPYTVSFSNFSTPGAGISWDFGDGNTSAASNPVHTFTQPGVFKVTQKASSGCGYDSTFAYITVLPAPVVSFTSLPQICMRDSLQFSNTSASLSGTIWDFGDGDTSLLYNPAHAWAQAGNYTVTLIGISSENGCPAKTDASIKVLDLPKIGFAPDRPDGCVPLTIEFSNQSQGATYFEWDFGDGNTQTGSVIQHTYSTAGQYGVHLRGVDTNGCRNDSTLNFITVYPLPTPNFSLQRDHICGLPVTVTLSNNTPDAVGYSWDFGNNSGSILNNPVTVYSTSGDYNILLEATNTFGCKNNTAQSFSAYAIPISDFSVLPDSGCAPLEVSFYNQSLNSTNALWLFSDGRQSTEFSPTLTFPVAGNYGVTLIASHRDVCFDTLAFDNLISVKPSPFANFSFEEILTTPPSGEFQFTDLSIDASNWHWDFGDGRNSDDQNPTNRYYSNGEKMVTLIVTSENGCIDDTTQTLIPRIIRGLFIPNAFTPTLSNGDASIFQPKGVGLKEYEIAVYSSYGQLLWSSDKLVEGRPAEFWDGKYKEELLPQDVYVWQVKRAVFEDGTVWEGNFDAGTGTGKKVGSVLLIR